MSAPKVTNDAPPVSNGSTMGVIDPREPALEQSMLAQYSALIVPPELVNNVDDTAGWQAFADELDARAKSTDGS